MKAIKSIAVVGAAAAGLVAVGTGAAVAGGHHSENRGAQGAAIGSPGAASGLLTQAVTSAQTNACGNATSAAAGILNPAFGNSCVNR